MFTDRELEVARMKLKGLMNKEVAKKLEVSEAYISQTINRITEKVKTVQDSIELLRGMEVIKEGPKYVLTEKGRKLSRLPKKTSKEPIKYEPDITFSSSGDWKYVIKGMIDFGRGYSIVGQNPIILYEGPEIQNKNWIKKECIASSNEEEPNGISMKLPETIEVHL